VVAQLSRGGLPVFLTGTAEEAPITARVAAAARLAGAASGPAEGEIVDLAGRTSIGALGALIARAALVVTNDTGTSHLADALRTPSVVVFLASDPRRWAPLDRALHVAVAAADLGERCDRAGEPGHGDCSVRGCLGLGGEPAASVEGVPTERVLLAIDDLLARHPPGMPSA
jgi:ADP-heptose:LPS heptosyltransferase